MNEFIDASGSTWKLGNIVGVGLRHDWPVYGTVPSTPLVPRPEWPERIAAMGLHDGAWYLSPPHDQDGIGMCNASATCGAIEASRLRYGLPPISLSGGDLYRRICGGRDQGSLLEDGLREAMARGVASVDVVPYLDWRRAPAKSDADKFVVLEAFVCPEFDHIVSALLEGFDVIVGVLWWDNYHVDADGWLPTTPRGEHGGHALHAYKPCMRDGKYGVWVQNSWTPKWGKNGRCVIPEPAFGGPVGGWWAVRAVVSEKGDVPPPQFS